jgi:hypothetical protein
VEESSIGHFANDRSCDVNVLGTFDVLDFLYAEERLEVWLLMFAYIVSQAT